MYYIVIDMRGKVGLNDVLQKKIGVTKCPPDFGGLNYEGPLDCEFSEGARQVPRRLLLFTKGLKDYPMPIDFDLLVKEHGIDLLRELLCFLNGAEGILVRRPCQ